MRKLSVLLILFSLAGVLRPPNPLARARFGVRLLEGPLAVVAALP
jgi:hypothetical protein